MNGAAIPGCMHIGACGACGACSACMTGALCVCEALCSGVGRASWPWRTGRPSEPIASEPIAPAPLLKNDAGPSKYAAIGERTELAAGTAGL
eukprot:CAMPEP_0181447556 /NCGR_PEP_ID=MMETSP1110-20121109/26683_1 /TAXON_ID=174948 /ORGANISM="Symbiodinium sp., Strain CCMP421" /LENGTH=91 /DNA_ID=CAMNT_0023571673 /DNA_START=424 /DNA_END=699 /DNA_ORIENTATION=-